MKTNPSLFRDLSFSIYEYGNELAPKRSKILREMVEKNGGKFIHYTQIKQATIPDFIISVKKLNLNAIKIKESVPEETIKEKFVDIKWVTDCIKENFLIERENYRITEDDAFTGEKRKADESDMDMSVKRRKPPQSETKKPPSFTQMLLEKLEQKVEKEEEKKNIKVKYFDKIYFSQQKISQSLPETNEIVAFDPYILKENDLNENNLISPEKTLKDLSKIVEESASEASNLDISTLKKNKEIDTNLRISHNLPKYIEEEEKTGGTENDYKKKVKNSDKLLEELHRRLIDHDKKREENGDYRNDFNEDDNFSTLNDNMQDEIFDHKRNFSREDDLLSLISREECEEIQNNLNSLLEAQAEESKNKNMSKNLEWRKKFACSAGSNQKNLNEHITSQLENMLEYHTNEKNTFEANAYRKAIAILRQSREKITVVDDIKKYKYLGKSIAGKIKEILLTGKIRKVDFLKNNDEKTQICRLFMKIHGVGIAAANKFYKKGYKTIEDLRNNQEELNSVQKLGLKYFEDSQIRIPREECEKILNKVKEALYKILPEEIIEIVLCGSYRRGRPTCGDMDILITRKDDGGIDGILSSLLTSLKKEGLVKDTLSFGKTSHENYVFMGICRLDETLPHRRVDIKIYKREQFPFALLYFTGSAYFNRSMRLLARKLGFSLSDQALEKVNRIKNEKFSKGEFVKCESEEDIFKALGLTYKEPSERDI